MDATFGQFLMLVMANKSDEPQPMPKRLADDWRKRFSNGPE